MRIGSPLISGRSPTNSCITHAVMTIPTSSSRLIVTLLVSRHAALRFSSAEKSSGRSYLQYVRSSVQ
ncbi:unnamed protein product [Ectocarpus sp. CCAP 1310/34]|nr:unnamed protein product [Ectocarpus sp. CCAP 1310/34]CAB1107482.1 unnamed protein product [Ectocarpus sp. CCAP 1310/34]CAB1108978.1 unnamed protein product [Ectocarpus sp. CCAP 1310/34]CAB1112349.1 unnamed protein product [Ectocarpus sp. CCAP 1310/34]